MYSFSMSRDTPSEWEDFGSWGTNGSNKGTQGKRDPLSIRDDNFFDDFEHDTQNSHDARSFFCGSVFDSMTRQVPENLFIFLGL